MGGDSGASCTDLQLVSNGGIGKINFLIYDSLKEMGTSVYKFFNAPCRPKPSIQDNDWVIISLQR
jgi:hypothetical protein